MHRTATPAIRVRLLPALLAALFAFGPGALRAAEKLSPDRVAELIPQLFKLHLHQREMDPAFTRRVVSEFINQLDPTRSFFLKEEAEKIVNLPDAELARLAQNWRNGDFQFFTALIKSYRETQIARDEPFHAGLDKRADEIRALLLDKKKLASAPGAPPVPAAPAQPGAQSDAQPPKPESSPGAQSKVASSEPAAKDAKAGGPAVAEEEEEETDKIKWNERSATNADRETRMLKTAAALYRVNKSYLSDAEAMNLAIQNLRDDRTKWLRPNVEDDVSKLFLKSFMLAMDPHTVYFEEDEDFGANLVRTFAGIGVQIRSCPMGAHVEALIKGGPTERSGKIAPRDQIVAVDGSPLAGLTISKIVRKIKGPKGSDLTLKVLKHDTKQTLTVTLTRDDINLAEMRVKGKTFDTPAGPIGFISVQNFYRGVHNDVKDRLKELSAARPLAGLVLDLRDNHGGFLDEAVDMAGLFVAGGPIVGERSYKPNGREDILWKDDTDASIVFSRPLVVLVNQFSASASEIVAGTLKDYGRAAIAGPTQTFGKGTVQRVIQLSTLNLPGEIKITTHQYFLAGGASVQRLGVEPDVKIPGLKLYEEGLERASPNAIPFNRIKGRLDMKSPDVQLWNEWKTNNLAMLQSKSKTRTDASQEYKDYLDPKKRKERLAQKEKELAERANKPADPAETKKEEKDYLGEEAVAIVQDMVATWPAPERQAAK